MREHHPCPATEQTGSQGISQMHPPSIWQSYKLKSIIHPPTQRISFGLREAALHISSAFLLLHFLINFSGCLERLLINHYCQAFRETFQTLSEIRNQNNYKRTAHEEALPVYCSINLQPRFNPSGRNGNTFINITVMNNVPCSQIPLLRQSIVDR